MGVGWYPVTAGTAPYDRAYFKRYWDQARTPIGRQLMGSRVEFVSRHYQGSMCDVGIGCGAFIERRAQRKQRTWGWDVNPAGLEWLEDRWLAVDPHLVPFPALSMWDVLEHMDNFIPLINNCKEWLFLSLPIFRDAEHALASKHFRPDEHVWYFTAHGLCWIMDNLGFDPVETNTEEVAIGREDIGSFAFHRRMTAEREPDASQRLDFKKPLTDY